MKRELAESDVHSLIEPVIFEGEVPLLASFRIGIIDPDLRWFANPLNADSCDHRTAPACTDNGRHMSEYKLLGRPIDNLARCGQFIDMEATLGHFSTFPAQR